MKKLIIVFASCLAMLLVTSVGFAEEAWKTSLNDAIAYSDASDQTMMDSAIKLALSEGVSLQDVLSQVQAVNPGAMQLALKSSFTVVADKASVVTAAVAAKVDTAMVVTTAMASNVSAGEVVAAAVKADATTAGEVVTAAIAADATQASQVVSAAIASGASDVVVVSSAVSAGGNVDQVTDGAVAAGVSKEAVAVTVATVQTAQAFETKEETKAETKEEPKTEESKPARVPPVVVDTPDDDDVSPN